MFVKPALALSFRVKVKYCLNTVTAFGGSLANITNNSHVSYTFDQTTKKV